MSLLLYFLLLAIPSIASVAELIISLIFIEWISNQWPSNEQIIVVFFVTILGTVVGGVIGYISSPYKKNPGGWEWKCIPEFYTCLGGWIGATIISLLTSSFLATTQQWVNSQWPANDQILLMCLLIILEIIVGWCHFFYMPKLMARVKYLSR